MPPGGVGPQAGRSGDPGEQTSGRVEGGVGSESIRRTPGPGRCPKTDPPLEAQAAAVLPDEGELPEHRSAASSQLVQFHKMWLRTQTEWWLF